MKPALADAPDLPDSE